MRKYIHSHYSAIILGVGFLILLIGIGYGFAIESATVLDFVLNLLAEIFGIVVTYLLIQQIAENVEQKIQEKEKYRQTCWFYFRLRNPLISLTSINKAMYEEILKILDSEDTVASSRLIWEKYCADLDKRKDEVDRMFDHCPPLSNGHVFDNWLKYSRGQFISLCFCEANGSDKKYTDLTEQLSESIETLNDINYEIEKYVDPQSI